MAPSLLVGWLKVLSTYFCLSRRKKYMKEGKLNSWKINQAYDEVESSELLEDGKRNLFAPNRVYIIQGWGFLNFGYRATFAVYFLWKLLNWNLKICWESCVDPIQIYYWNLLHTVYKCLCMFKQLKVKFQPNFVFSPGVILILTSY